MKIQIAASILSADFGHLGEEVSKAQKAGADIIHVDVMDGRFVPNITVGPQVLSSIRPLTNLPIDCHLMIENPEKYIESFAKAGSDWISVHVEACDLKKILPIIKKLGMRAGAAINPPTPIEKIYPALDLADYILVMTVNPGFGGQRYIDSCTKKIADLKRVIKGRCEIEVDGGINSDNVSDVIEAGASIIVAGSAIFESKDYEKVINELKGERV